MCSGLFPLLCRRFVFLLCAMLCVCVCHSRAEHSLPLSSHVAFDLSDVASVRIFDASNSADLSNVRNSCHPMTDLTSWDDTDERLTESKAWFSQAMMKDRTSSDKRDPRVNAVMHRTSWEHNFWIFFRFFSPLCLMWLFHSNSYIDKDGKKVKPKKRKQPVFSTRSQAKANMQIFGSLPPHCW